MSKQQEISEYLTYSQMNLINDFRYNILQLAMWSRAYVNAAASEFGSLEGNTRKLHAIPELFYNSLKQYMGEAMAREIQNYIFQHILMITNMVDAFLANDKEAVDRYIAQSYQFADQLSTFLASNNLYWSKDHWMLLITNYVKMTIDEIVAILSGQYDRGIDIYEEIHDNALLMADYMSRGLIANLNSGRSFPDNIDDFQPQKL